MPIFTFFIYRYISKIEDKERDWGKDKKRDWERERKR